MLSPRETRGVGERDQVAMGIADLVIDTRGCLYVELPACRVPGIAANKGTRSVEFLDQLIADAPIHELLGQ